jgi:hypothetical protein
MVIVRARVGLGNGVTVLEGVDVIVAGAAGEGEAVATGFPRPSSVNTIINAVTNSPPANREANTRMACVEMPNGGDGLRAGGLLIIVCD